MSSLLILIPFISIIFLNLPLGAITRKPAFLLAGAFLLFQITLALLHPFVNWSNFNDPFGAFLVFRLMVDNLSIVLILAIGIVGLVTTIVARSIIAQEQDRLNFLNLLLVAVMGMNTLVMVRDLFSVYVFIEVTAVASFILIAMQKDKLALEGAFKYLILSAVATIMMLSAVAIFVLLSGSTSFSAVTGAFAVSENIMLARLAMGLFICGLCIKSGIVPFHSWVPDAYSAAPSPVSVLLAGIVTKASGVYVLIRLITSVFVLNLEVQNILMFLGALSILVGAIAAMTQTDFKRMLSFSSISQVGYIILGLGCNTPLAIIGAVFHLFNHAIFKSLLFVNAASVEKQVNTTDIEKMGGLGSRMPVTGATSVIGLLSTAGVPPLAGFWSKLMIILALFSSGNFAYATVALLASVLTLGYFLTLERKVFFGKIRAGLENTKEASFGLVFSQVLLAAITIGVGVAFPFVLKWF